MRANRSAITAIYTFTSTTFDIFLNSETTQELHLSCLDEEKEAKLVPRARVVLNVPDSSSQWVASAAISRGATTLSV